jgi:Family of unknown function (DUF6174)
MRAVAISLAAAAHLSIPAFADPVFDFEEALEQWRTAGMQNYSFVYEWRGGVVIAPKCADAKIRVVVKNGVGQRPVVVRGSRECPRGTRGDEAIGFSVPDTIDLAFEEIRRYIYDPPTPAHVAVAYDDRWGIPVSYYVEKLEIEDNDEGFAISDFKVRE